MRLATFLFCFFLLSGCKNPETFYFKEVQNWGFIPFKNPINQLGVGTIFRGKPSKLTPIAPSIRCFPESIQGVPTEIRWVTELDLPHTYRNMQIDFNVKLNSLMAMGTPGIQFNLSMNKVNKVDLSVKGAQIERFDHLALQDFYQQAMTEECRIFVLKYPFTYEALKITSMSFVFLDQFGGKISLNATNISDFANIGADVIWNIENGYELVVTSPKYIGYRLVKLRETDDGWINLVSSSLKRDAFVWEELGR